MWFDKKVNFDIHKFDEFYQAFVNENCEYSAENVHFLSFSNNKYMEYYCDESKNGYLCVIIELC